MTTRVKLLKEQGIQEKNRQTEIKKEKNEWMDEWMNEMLYLKFWFRRFFASFHSRWIKWKSEKIVKMNVEEKEREKEREKEGLK